MKDAVYSGRDLDEALAAASRGLGVDRSELRYVVLDAGGKDSPLRVAVLLDAMRPASRPAPARVAAPASQRPPRDVRAQILEWFERLREASGAALEPTLEEETDRLVVRVTDPAGFFETDDDAPLRALEHLLLRAFGVDVAPRRLVLELPGQREQREVRLRKTALALAEAVRADGVERSTGPLNSYERRLVHMTIAEAGGLETFSTGEGPERSVTIRRASGE